MSGKQATYQAAKSGDAIYVQVHGLGSMHNVPALEAFALTSISKGARQFVLDLSKCTGVDSTFMGTLLSLHNALEDKHGEGEGTGIVLINVDEHCEKQLSSVGIDAILTLKQGKTKMPRKLKLTEVDAQPLGERERLKVMVRVHKALVAADPRNEAKFGAFLEAVIGELGQE